MTHRFAVIAQSTAIALAAVLAFVAASCTQPSAPSATRSAPSGGLARIASTTDAAGLNLGTTIPNLRVTTISGATLTLDDLLRDRRALVIAMASAECPLAVEYGPRMAAIEQEFEGQAAFLHVNAVDGESIDVIRDMIRDAGLRGTYVRDNDASVRLALRPKTTTEAFVLSPTRTIMYRGAIDDQYRLGGKAARVQRQYLRDALRAVIVGNTPDPAATSSPGCLIDMPRIGASLASADSTPAIPFYPRIADILERNCIECHQPGGTAPFSLASPASVDGRAAMIAAVVREGIMPPNHGLSWIGPQPLVHDRTMSREDRELLLAWLASDRSAGSVPASSTPTPAARTTGRPMGRPMGRDNAWLIGTPDYMLITPGPTLQPQDVPTTQRYFIAINLDSDAWVEAIECRPVMRDSVATAQLWLIEPGQPLPSMTQFPPSQELFASFSRSDRVVTYGPGAARKLPKNSVLVLDLVGRAMVPVEPSQLRIAMRFAASPPQRQIHTRVIAPASLRIPAGQDNANIKASLQLPAASRLIAIRPLMGPRVQGLRVTTSDRSRVDRELLDLHRYDWRWLIRYPLREPLDLVAGARVSAEWFINNAPSNPVNPDPAVDVTLGIGDAREQLGVAIEYEVESKIESSAPSRAGQ